MPATGDMEILNQMMSNFIHIKTQLTLPPIKNKVILKETNGVTYYIELKQIPTKFILIKPENLDFLSKNITGSNGEKQISDYILISESAEGKWIVYIEMKRGNAEVKKIRNQLIGSKCFIDYCKSLVNFFYEGEQHFKDFEERYVYLNTKIEEQSIQKTTTVPPNHRLNDNPSDFLPIEGGNGVYFRKLLG